MLSVAIEKIKVTTPQTDKHVFVSAVIGIRFVMNRCRCGGECQSNNCMYVLPAHMPLDRMHR